jgi:anti-sigma regulatory factor (Ser/Thr protein kinase)
VRQVGSGTGLLASQPGEDWRHRHGEGDTTDDPSSGRVIPGWPGPAYADGVPPLVDLSFDPDTLHAARARMRACADDAGLPEDQAGNVVLAVHELAANAICHGRGAGRLRVWNLAGALHCQVDDGDSTAGAGRAAENAFPCEPGHGLWVVRQVADELESLSGPAGTSVLVRFGRHDYRPGIRAAKAT